MQVQAQETMSAPLQKNDIAIHYDVKTGKISLLNNQSGHKITHEYLLEVLELEIYDAKGQYVGSLELNDFQLPQDEIDNSERLKINQMRIVHQKTKKTLHFSNVDFAK